MDLLADLVKMAQADIKVRYSDAPDDGPDSVILRWHRMQKRVPSARPWTIVESAELIAQRYALSAEDQAGLDAVLDRARTGQDLFPHLSRRILNPDFHDLMLYDWNINHFHLRSESRSDGLFEGSKNVLFAWADEATGKLYCIGVYAHEFSKQEVLAIMERNWPELLEPYKLKGIDVKKGYTDEDVAAFRKIGANVVVPDQAGSGFTSLGGGVSTAGTSFEGQRFLNWAKRVLKDAEAAIIGQKAALERDFQEQADLAWGELDFHLTQFGPCIDVKELKTGTTILSWEVDAD